MRSVVVHAPLDLRIEETGSTGAPGAGEVKVDLAAGGICGSDLHYYQHGGFGTMVVSLVAAPGAAVKYVTGLSTIWSTCAPSSLVCTRIL